MKAIQIPLDVLFLRENKYYKTVRKLGNESIYHLILKYVIKEELERLGYEVELEKRLTFGEKFGEYGKGHGGGFVDVYGKKSDEELFCECWYHGDFWHFYKLKELKERRPIGRTILVVFKQENEEEIRKKEGKIKELFDEIWRVGGLNDIHKSLL